MMIVTPLLPTTNTSRASRSALGQQSSTTIVALGHSGLLRLRNHPAGKDEFLAFSIPANFWQYSFNAALYFLLTCGDVSGRALMPMDYRNYSDYTLDKFRETEWTIDQ
jgi:hypothetical protein